MLRIEDSRVPTRATTRYHGPHTVPALCVIPRLRIPTQIYPYLGVELTTNPIQLTVHEPIIWMARTRCRRRP